MRKMLRNVVTGQVFPWDRHLAQREDMVEFVQEPPPQPPPPVAKPKTPTENPTSASANRPPLPPLDDAIDEFRRQVSRVGHRAANRKLGRA